ncbi:asparagine synthase (glutamine-hydrolyzing) [Roseibium album]|uniref:asparagine synthase (glutamine-hydrolyzing) n=1 Tax=Roseibium album TaxID=311410 RepID=UPI00391C9A2A
MCGILGAVGKSPPRPLSKPNILEARDLMRTRGPDSEGFLELTDGRGGNCYLAHRRLAIQDLSENGSQPMRSADGRYTIVYNGEVYNAQSLRKQLEQLGTRFKSTSDTEVILEGYSCWGAEVVQRLNGIFAFAIWDQYENRFFLARDRLGVKPLYLSESPGFFAFASDLRALRHLGLGSEIDTQALCLYLALGYIPAPRSIWAGITKLEAGQFLSWRAGEESVVTQYWEAPDDTDFEGKPEAIEDLIDNVVEEQLLSDVPVGLFLSGGLDSSLLASSLVARGRANDNLVAITAAFPGNDRGDEAPIAKRTAKQLGIHLECLPFSSDVDPYFDAAVAAMDEPIAFNAIVTQAGVSQLASEAGLKVVLTGDGGDEVFGGYTWHYPSARKPPSLFDLCFGNFFDLRMVKRKISELKAARFEAKSEYFSYMRSVFSALRPDEISGIQTGSRAAQIEELLLEVFERHNAARLPDKRRWQRIDLYTFCQDVVLPKVDRTGMAYSIEARPPLLDHRIVEWGLSRPLSDPFDAFPKNAVRQILKKRGLGFLLNEPKRGFSLKSRGGPKIDKREFITQNVSKVGLTKKWKPSVSRKSEARGHKIETLYWLSRWHAAHVDDSKTISNEI